MEALLGFCIAITILGVIFIVGSFACRDTNCLWPWTFRGLAKRNKAFRRYYDKKSQELSWEAYAFGRWMHRQEEQSRVNADAQVWSEFQAAVAAEKARTKQEED